MSAREGAGRREIFGWAMFDFANSSYTTVIVTVVFSVVFPRLVVGDAPAFETGNLLWSVALSASYALVVLTAPVLGAIMDFRAAKKRFLFGSYLLTVVATASLWLVGPGDVALGMVLLVASNYGFAVGESFAAAFLPELGPKESLGKISGYAWGLGYIGGLLSTFLVVTLLGPQTAENFPRLRWVGPMTAGFFLVAAIPTFLFLRERGEPRALPSGSTVGAPGRLTAPSAPNPGSTVGAPGRLTAPSAPNPGETLVSIGLSRLRATARELRDFRDLLWFFAGLFFAMAGLTIVISFAFIYGDQVVRWRPATQLAMFVLTNLSAAAGAVLFGMLQDRWGNLRTYRLTLLVWCVAVAGIYGTPSITSALGGALSAEHVFLGVGTIAGLCLGATQSAGRTLVAVFAPASKSGEFFGFWGLAAKLSAIFGLLSLGLLQAALGLQRAILVCGVFFFVALLLSLAVDEARGRAAATAHEGE